MSAPQIATNSRDELVDALLRSDAPRTTLLCGDPGMGKTTVLAAVAARATAAWSWDRQCHQMEAGIGLSVLGDLFGALPGDVVTALPVPQQRAIETVLYRATEPIALTDRLLTTTLVGALRELSHRGSVVVSIDDLHWCDGTSLAALRSALVRIDAPSLRVLLTARTGLAPDVPHAVRVELPPLSVDEVEALVRALAPQVRAAQLAEIVRMSAGNPFFATELARAVIDGRSERLPSSLRTALDSRIDELPPSVRAAILVIALRGDVDVREAPLAELGAAFEANVLTSTAGRVQFSHPLLASAVIAEARPDALRVAHLAAADAIDDPVVRALHRGAALAPSEALAAELDAAVGIARSRADWTSFCGLARLALAATPNGARPTHRVIEAASAELLGGDVDLVLPLAEEVAARTSVGVELVTAAEMRDLFIDDHDLGAAEFGRLADRLEPGSDDHRQARIDQASRLHKAGRLADAIGLLVSLLPEDHDTTWSQLVGNIAYLERMAGRQHDARLLAEAVEVERAWNAEHAATRPLEDAAGHAGIIAMLDDRHDEAAALLEMAERAVMSVGVGPRCQYYIGAFKCRTGHVAEAIRYLSAEMPLAMRGEAKTDALLRLGHCTVWADHEQTRHLVDAAQAQILDNDHRENADLCFVHGFDLLLDGHAQAAFLRLREAVRHLDACGYLEPSRIPARPALIEAAVAVGEVPIARLMCADLDRASRALSSRWGRAATLRSRAVISVADGMDDADSMLAASAQQFEDIGVPLEAARSYHLLGSRRRRLGHRTAAREALMRAHEISLGCGANRLAVTIDLEMRRLGGRTTGRTDLTGAEVQVARLVADGMRNQDVAEALHVTVKTVEAHLSRIYRKLGVRGRVALARAMNDETS